MVRALKTDTDRLRDAEELIRRKNAELTTKEQTIKRLHRDNDTAEAIRKEIWGLAEYTPVPPKWLTGKRIPHGDRGGPVLMLSDPHYGEVINQDEVGGVNVYNSKIAAKRLQRLAENTIDIAKNHMGRHSIEYPGIVVCLGGDLIGGDIHEELAISNDKTPHQSVNEMTDLLGAVFETFLSNFPRVFVPAVVGNHGRSTQRPRFKGRVFTNYDWSIACNLERYFRKEKRIQFMIPNETDARFDVFGTRFLLTHGDTMGVKGGDGQIGALGPIARGRARVGQSEAAIGRDFDYMLIGHWHQLLWLPDTICNGAIKGYDEYARLAIRSKYKPPAQALFFVHPERGITARWEVALEEKTSSPANKVWVSWQQ